VITDPGRSEEESIRRDLDVSKGDVGGLLDVGWHRSGLCLGALGETVGSTPRRGCGDESRVIL